jgi:hypothetical protein
MPPRTAGLTGKVFLITGGGDIREARFASLFVLSGDVVAQFRATLLQTQEWLTEQNSDMEKKFTDRSDIAREELIHCHIGLLGINRELTDLAKRDLLNMATLPAKDPEMVLSETDEQGIFKVTGLKPGGYTIAVSGSAGTNFALWIEDVSLESGKDTSVKMHSPSMACSKF